MDKNIFQWLMFELIHGKRMDRVLWVGIPCVRNGKKGDMVCIMPANPRQDIGTGPGHSIWIEECEVQIIAHRIWNNLQ